MKEVKIRLVENGFIVTVGEGENGSPAPQYVAENLDHLSEVLAKLFGTSAGGNGA